MKSRDFKIDVIINIAIDQKCSKWSSDVSLEIINIYEY